jgi:hypothetical protein
MAFHKRQGAKVYDLARPSSELPRIWQDCGREHAYEEQQNFPPHRGHH